MILFFKYMPICTYLFKKKWNTHNAMKIFNLDPTLINPQYTPAIAVILVYKQAVYFDSEFIY